ncbi:MAG TPA: BlaI/MecI/CopY family transcriptional regulator [Terriglobales bacterium]|nr:BlaI/MecI/CopY family transcriptional regulator [Terriglobales bacterium]
MARKKPVPALTPLELEIMQALWDLGPAPLQAVHEHVARRKPRAYTTVQTVLQVLHRKGKVAREQRQRAYLYRALETRQTAARRAVSRLLDNLFGGSAESLVLNLVETKQLDAAALERARRLLKGDKS